ncbi:MAG: hypothetical protein Q8P41_21410 [Pseudomonadota bacterium]|nr:hypothetical protein [Pseudomonadota bacterium]
MILPFLLACSILSPDDTGGSYVDEPEIAGPEGLWALVHPTTPAARGSGIYLVDTTLGSSTGPLVLPAVLTSPHALFDDGDGLLVGGFVDDGTESPDVPDSVFRLDYDGTEVTSYTQPSTEGITAVDGTVYVAEPSALVHLLTPEWSPVTSIEVESVVQDVAIDGRTLYVLSNDDRDSIRAYDLDDPTAPPSFATEQATFNNMGYAMMFWDGHLVVADQDDGGNFLRHIDVSTGESLGITRIALGGWITAISVEE